MAEHLASTRAKIDRAKKHLAELREEISVYHARSPYRILSDRESKPGFELYRFEFIEAIPDGWGPIIGDVIHNLRASLDALATALVVANGTTSSSVIKKTYFPIGSAKAIFDKKILEDLRGASDEARRIVERLRPYKGGINAFWRLHQLDILDKHTNLIPVGISNTKILWKVSFAGIFEQMGITDTERFPELPPLVLTPTQTGYPLKNGDVVFTYGLENDPEGKFRGDTKITLDIAFGEGQIIDGQPVLSSLQEFVDLAERVFGIFEKYYFRP